MPRVAFVLMVAFAGQGEKNTVAWMHTGASGYSDDAPFSSQSHTKATREGLRN